MDTGSGCSIIDLGTLQRIGLDNCIDKSSPKALINASGDTMKILGTVKIDVTIAGSQPRNHVFQVLDSVTYSNVLLGRDFMRHFGSVQFDFARNSIQLGKLSLSGLSPNTARVRLCENVTIPPRSEAVLLVKSSTKNSLLPGDFEPKIGPKIKGLYATRSRVIPNIDGVFQITVLNVNSSDITLKSRTSMGFIQPADEIVMSVAPDENLTSTLADIKISDRLSRDEKSEVTRLIKEYQDIFAANPKKPKQTTLLEHRIITNDALPVSHKPRRVPVAWEKDMDQQVSEMLANDIIRPSSSPWNAPVILVKKKDNSTRFVCDFRGVNDVTKRDTYPLPHIKDVIDKMAGARYWTTLDAASAYWSIPLAESDKEKTAFSVPHGKYEFNVTPYGLSNAGSSYQRMIDMCLSGLSTERVLAYMDDIVIFNSTFQEHIQDLAAVFDRLRLANVTLKGSKCVFAAESVDFLGYELSSQGIKPQHRLTQAIDQFSPPESRKELKRFLGLSGFYRSFIQDYAVISEPLNKLTCDNVPFLWTNQCESAFKELKRRLTSQPVLAFPKLNETFTVEVDASDYAAGGVLSQTGEDGLLHPIAYFSTAFKGSQRQWAPITKEAFALVLAVRHWHVYLAGTEFILNTDHNPLVHLRKQKDPRGKFGRWIAELEEYDYTVKYIRGKDNVKADSLSRDRCANDNQPISSFEDKVYATVVENSTFLAQLRQEQNTDPLISRAKRLVAAGEIILQGRLKRVQNQLRVEDDVLTKSGRPIVPASLRRFVLSEIHNVAHFGTDKTYALIKERFFWPNMYGHVKRFVTNCTPCQQTKCDTSPPKAPLLPMVIPDAPMQFIALDVSYMPKNNKGFEYFLIIGDLFSKYIEAVPMKDQTAPTIINALMTRWIYTHGTPHFILSDQGSNVDGETVKEICNTLGIEKRRSSAYHSQGNGFAERNIRNVKDMLRTVLLQRKLNQSKWVSLLPELVFALNTSESKATKCIPFNVVFGRDARLPIDVLFDHDRLDCPRDINTAAEYAEDRNFALKDVYDTVITNLQLSKEKMQAQYNKNIRFIDHKAGDKVWLKVKYYKTGENRKLAPRRRGPWTVIKKLPNGVNFEIVNDQTKDKKIVHHDRLSPIREGTEEDGEARHITINRRTSIKGRKPDNSDASDSTDSESSDSDDSNDYSPDTDDDNQVQHRQYPLRNRIARQIPNNIPWSAIQI